MFAALTEGFGILMLLPLLQNLDSAHSSADNADAQLVVEKGQTGEAEISDIAQYLQSFLTYLGIQDSITAVILFIIAAFVFKGILSFGALGFNAYLRGELLSILKGRLFDHYRNMSYEYYSSRDTGHFINLVNEQITRALQSFFSITQLGAQFINTVVYVTLAFLIAWRFGAMALVCGILLLLVFRWLNSYVRELSRKNAQENGHLAKLLVQLLHAFKYLTATGQGERVGGAVTASIDRLTDYQIRTGIAAGLTQAVREPIAVIFIMLIVMAQIVYLQQPIEPILVSIILFYKGLNATLSIQGYWQKTLETIGSMELVHQEFISQQENREVDGSQVAPLINNGVSFKDVSFSYGKELGDVLKGVSLEIPVKTSVAFVGESGAGKSTMLDLITLMHKPKQGQVMIDNIPGEDIKHMTWREQIGYVSQETVIFDDTIANNICLWSGEAAQDSELMNRLREAARQAHISTFIESLPDGYETMVGDRGLRLSGGQRQRIFIARELFRKPNLLILDEATSALDSESERTIQKSIDALKGDVTVIIVAHRLSTIRNVDQIYVFGGGKLLENGTYDELRQDSKSKFYELVEMQHL